MLRISLVFYGKFIDKTLPTPPLPTIFFCFFYNYPTKLLALTHRRITVPSSEPKETVQVEEKPVPPSPGRLVAEPYSWKSLVTGQPILRICSTGTKASVLTLPPGRHVLRFLIQAPHGYHVEMASQTAFVYGDEDTVMACLTKVFNCNCT